MEILILILLSILLAVSIYWNIKLLLWISIIAIIGYMIYVYIFKKTVVTEKFTMFNFLNDQANVQAHPEIYCGENAILPEEYDEIGTRTVCLQKGIGIGMAMPNPERNAAIARAANRPPLPRLYCGAQDRLPDNYVGFGTNMDCLKRGVGVGMRLPDDRRQNFQNQPVTQLNKKEIMTLAKRLGITTEDKTRNQTLRHISNRLRA